VGDTSKKQGIYADVDHGLPRRPGAARSRAQGSARTLTSLSEQDEDFIENSLENLYKLSVDISGKNYEIVGEYIYVHEFGLTLDVLAHIYIKPGKPISLKTRALFEALALKMGMKDGDEWTGVAKI